MEKLDQIPLSKLKKKLQEVKHKCNSYARLSENFQNKIVLIEDEIEKRYY